MSGKAKMRCARCHKPFKASSAKQTLCAECEAKERRARAATKATPSATATAAPVAKPKIVGPGANILVPGLVPPPAAAPDVAPNAPHAHGAYPYPARETQPGMRRPEPTAPDRDQGHAHGSGSQSYPQPHARAQPQQGHAGQHAGHGGPGPRGPQGRTQPRPSSPPRPKKEPAPVITLTPELRERIEARYRELAQPVEFDGIRTRIAAELSVPKSLVKQAVLELRQREQMPSWWELQGFHGSNEELERIRATYTPHLPLPAVGVHKQIAADLGLDAGAVYQAIRRIRAELHLPQYNPPESHAAESPAASASAIASAETGVEAEEGVAAPARPVASGGEASPARAG